MRTLSGLGMMAALAICYIMFFRSQAEPGGLSSAESQPLITASADSAPADLRTAPVQHSVYRAELDRAHTAARQIQASHAEVGSF